jgi:ATP-dependent Lon protease
LNILDKKICSIFPEESVYKIPERYSIFSGQTLPSFIKDWLIKKFTDEYGDLDKNGLIQFLDSHIPHKDSNIRSRLIQGEEVKVLARIVIESDIKKGIHKFAIPDISIKMEEGRIPDYLIRKNNALKEGETWGVVSLVYTPPEGKESGYVELADYKPFKPYDIDVEYFRNARKEFTLQEWIDVLIRSMEYNPDAFESLNQKLMFLTRLLVFIEPNLNIIELAPKGTGKSYVFGNLSKYGWLISGGTVSRAKLFYDIGRDSLGIITMYDFVAMDEIQTITFSDENELRGALKSYLESGEFAVGKRRQTSSTSLILLGNIPLTDNSKPINNKYFGELPRFFQESALLDRFHGFIEGWKLPRINEDLKLKGYTLNVEYFSEILGTLRTVSDFSAIVSELLDIPPRSDTRDTKAVKKITTAYLKLLFPHVKDVAEIDKNEFKNFCFDLAFEKRGIIRKQISLIDSEFKTDMPEIKVNME